MKLSNVLRSAEDNRCGGRVLIFFCPACQMSHSIYVEGDNSKGPQWTFNGDVNKPTFSPSVKVSWSEPSDVECEFDDRTKDINKVCHFFVRNGMIEFCGDCTHDLKNKSVPMVSKYFY